MLCHHPPTHLTFASAVVRRERIGFSPSHPPSHTTQVPSGWKTNRLWKWFETNLYSFTDDVQLRRMLDASVSSFLQFAVMNYNILCSKSFEVFVCDEQESGEQFLVAGPEITCWTPRHYGADPPSPPI
jgi:hypothetical protein